MIMTYYCIIMVPKSLSFRYAVAALIFPFPCGSPLDRWQSSHRSGNISQDAARQAQERAKQNEQPDSPIKTCPLPEVNRSYYQEQGEVKSTEERNGVEEIHTWFYGASPSIRYGPISWHRNRSTGSP